MKTTATCLILSCTVILSACSGSSSSSDTTVTTTGKVLCSLSNSGSQRLTYNNVAPGGTPASIDETLPFSYAWSCDSSNRTLTANGVPDHAVTGGEFATKVSAQTVSQSTTLNPVTTGSSTSVKVPGYALNGIKFDPATAGTCVDSATSTSSCNYGGGTGTWRMEAMADPTVSPWRFSFGVDTNNLGHVQQSGEYHYHGLPSDLMKARNSQYTSSMTLVGWAADGFPIYAQYGYSNATNTTSAIKKMTGSYRVKTTPSSGRPSTSDFAMGHFQQDWEYVAGLGDLDDCNGRNGVTPEFPDGIYHYYLTSTYPFIPRCNKGSVSSGNGGDMLPPGGGGMPPPNGMPPA